ncbi:ABC transporter permease subunit [Candidatus Saccharibacteria bacterium]|nr:ABC transporter permease subunit [Candidatus Saccharibacteria bacterium]
MLALILQTIKKSKWSIVGYTLGAALLVWLLVALFPSFSTQAANFTETLVEFYPEEFLKAFNIEIGSFLGSIEGFLSGEHYSLMWPLLLIILAISFGGGALAGEIDHGTIEVLLSQPISRTKLFLGKYLAGAVIILTFVFASALSVVPFAEIYNVDYQLQNHLTLAVLGACFGFALLGITMMFSSFFSDRGKVTLVSAVLMLAMYFVNVVAALKENLADLKYLSFFHYFESNTPLLRNDLELESVAVFLGVGLVCTIVGLIWFNRRDIAIS